MTLVTNIMSQARSANDETIYASNTDIYNLDLEKKSLSVVVPYPGRISGLCGIEIRADR